MIFILKAWFGMVEIFNKSNCRETEIIQIESKFL